MQLTVAFLQLALLIAVPAQGGVFAPSLLPSKEPSYVVFRIGSGKSSCKDDPTWVDQDGDGCATYASAINNGFLSREVACGAESAVDHIDSGDPEGAAIHCRSTCGTCPKDLDAEVVHAALSEEDASCVDDPSWTDEDGDGCDVYAKHVESGVLTQDIACGFQAVDGLFLSGNPEGAAKHCRATCGTCQTGDNGLLRIAKQIVAESPQYDQAPSLLDSKSSSGAHEMPSNQCVDDPEWVDMDGDGCAAYAHAIANWDMTQAQACGRDHVELESGNPGEAAKYCPATCGTCQLEALADNDTEMKDMIRMLVEQESELILQAATTDEPEEEDVPEVTTTTTTAVKKLPELELCANATWAVYSAPDKEEESAILSGTDLLQMSPMPQQSSVYKIRETIVF